MGLVDSVEGSAEATGADASGYSSYGVLSCGAVVI